MSTFWNLARKIMQENNISQVDIAKYVGKPKGTVNRWYNDDIVPSAVYALKIADLLEVDIRYLITGESLSNEENDIKEILNNPELKKTLDVLKQLDKEDLSKFRAAFKAIAAHSAADESRIVGGSAG